MIYREKNINLSVQLLPNEQSRNYMDVLFKKLVEQYETKAFEKYGIIHKINRINKIIKEEMMKIIPTVQFLLETSVELYYPMTDDIIQMKISKILTCGIFLQESCFRVLLPVLPMEYEISKEQSLFFEHKVTGERLQENDTIELKITSVRFEKNSFHCLGNFRNKII